MYKTPFLSHFRPFFFAHTHLWDTLKFGVMTAFRGGTMGVLEQTNIRITTSCTGDFNSDGVVDVNDLLVLIAAWGLCDACPEDINADGIVDVNDLLLVIAAWGPCE